MAKGIVLACGSVTYVSDEDYELVSRFSWHIMSKGYVAGRIGSGYVLLHRFLLGAKRGIVHHKDRNPLNNTRENLVLTNYAVNNQARHGIKKFPFIGIYWDKTAQKFRASIRVKTKHIRLGTFDDILKAALAYDEAAVKYYGEDAMTNEKYIKELLEKLEKAK